MNAIRPEIQGLRALAVILVVIFHLWPNALPGGFVGVDVFFVISGFLITGLLFREHEQVGKISLLRFYERRVRRLLPAATLVLFAVALATPLLPAALWEETAQAIIASALYVQNWLLVFLAVDYLGAENVPTPVQHYWSLSIEEQFYIIWPLIMIAGGALANAFRAKARGVLFALLAAITIASFSASVYFTLRDPAAAYFASHTRIWELGIGGLLALTALPDLSQPMRGAMRVVGLALIAAACALFKEGVAFPGYLALAPVLGTAMVIAAGQSTWRWSVYRALATPAAQSIGGLSYSLYLWHWPMIIFYQVFAPGPLSFAAGVWLAAGMLAISALSKRFVEDPFRRTDGAAKTSWRAVGFGAGAIAMCVAAAGVIVLVVRNQPLAAPLNQAQSYPGPAAILEGAPVPQVDAFIPAAALVKRDNADAYARGCHLAVADTELNPCVYGAEDAPYRVILAGDSHAANWIPAFEALARTHNWRVETHTKSGCPFLLATVSTRRDAYEECRVWGENLLRHIGNTHPDLVVLTQSSGARILAEGDASTKRQAMIAALTETWRAIETTGTDLAVIADTPRHRFDVAQCLAQAEPCVSQRSEALRFDPIVTAHEQMPEVALVDMNDALCTPIECPLVVGNVVAFRDQHHLTATYARMLAPVLAARIEAAEARAAPAP